MYITRVLFRNPILVVALVFWVLALLVPTPSGPSHISYLHMCRIRPSRPLCGADLNWNKMKVATLEVTPQLLQRLEQLDNYPEVKSQEGKPEFTACPTREAAIVYLEKEGKLPPKHSNQ